MNEVSQSAASQSIAELERQNGVTFLDRSTRPLSLTEPGRVYLDFCREVLRRKEDLDASLDSFRHGAEGVVRVAAIYSVQLSEMTELEHEFAQACPSAELQVEYLRPEKIYEAVLAGAAAVDPRIGTVPLLLAVVLFLWTPPHFWSLAIAFRKDYEAAGVPMLPIVVGDARAARAIFAHTVALVALSLLPAFLGLGPFYRAAAAAGGAWFVSTSWRLLREPGPRTAMRNFHASLAQLTLVLTAALIEGALL